MASNTSKALKRSKRTRSSSFSGTNFDSYVASSNGTTIKRVRTPHAHDVLSGRGGSINSHTGNIQFRKWVAVRKNDYNLAVNKSDKARVAREVIALVKNQDPPGRFLQRDPTSPGTHAFWVELDDEKMMAKTSQALREGAPAIREAHKDEIEEKRLKAAAAPRRAPESEPQYRAPSIRSSVTPPALMNHPGALYAKDVVAELRANAEAAATLQQQEEEDEQPPYKRVRMEYNGVEVAPDDETPPLAPLPSPHFAELDNGRPLLLPLPSRNNGDGNGDRGLNRTHSLALSDYSLGEWANEEFVNPFEDEQEREIVSQQHPLPSPRTGWFTRDTSSSDMGGIGALYNSNNNNDSNPSISSGSSGQGVRSTNSIGNLSCRYDSLDPLLLHNARMNNCSTPCQEFDWDWPPTPVSP